MQNSFNDVLVRSFQLAFSLRNISLRGVGKFKKFGLILLVVEMIGKLFLAETP